MKTTLSELYFLKGRLAEIKHQREELEFLSEKTEEVFPIEKRISQMEVLVGRYFYLNERMKTIIQELDSLLEQKDD